MAAPLQDVVLTKSGQLYDIAIRADGDLDTGDFFDATILTSIFTEKRASPEQVVTPERRRGWIGSHNEDFVLGNQAWVFGQLRNRQVEHNELAGIYKASLIHMVDDGIAKKISSTITIGDLGPTLSIRIERPNNKVDYRHFKLWENTGA